MSKKIGIDFSSGGIRAADMCNNQIIFYNPGSISVYHSMIPDDRFDRDIYKMVFVIDKLDSRDIKDRNDIILKTKHIFLSFNKNLKDKIKDEFISIVSVPMFFLDVQRKLLEYILVNSGYINFKFADNYILALFGSQYNIDGKNYLIYSIENNCFCTAVVSVENSVIISKSSSFSKKISGSYFNSILQSKILHTDLFNLEFSSNKDRSDFYFKLYKVTEKIKDEFFYNQKLNLLDYIYEFGLSDYLTGNKIIEQTYDIGKFGTDCSSFIDDSFLLCDKTLNEAGIFKNEFDNIIMLGKNCRLPFIKAALEKKYNKEVVYLNEDAPVIGAVKFAQISDFPERNTDDYISEGEKNEHEEKKKNEKIIYDSKWANLFYEKFLESENLYNSGSILTSVDSLFELISEIKKFMSDLLYRKGCELLTDGNSIKGLEILRRGLSFDEENKQIKEKMHTYYENEIIKCINENNHTMLSSHLKNALSYKSDCKKCLAWKEQLKNFKKKNK